MEEPQKEHARGISDRPFLSVRFVLALRVAVNVRDRRNSRVAQGRLTLGDVSARPLILRQAQNDRGKKRADHVLRQVQDDTHD